MSKNGIRKTKSDKMSEKVLKCWYCKDEVEKCDRCDKEFKLGDVIICSGEGEHHFCSKNCMYEFSDGWSLPAKTYLD